MIMKGKTKTQKGITLIALIITIVVLLILAAVAISSIQNDGILGQAQGAAGKYNQSVVNEQETLGKYENYLNRGDGTGNGNGESINAPILDKDGNNIVEQVVTKNTEAWDEYGNKIVVPVGFKIRVDASTNNADTVTEGIVIEDCTETVTKGSQFVWIPVGKVYTDAEKTETNAKTITLGRYDFNKTTGAASSVSPYGSYKEDTAASHNSKLKNTIARDIEAFKTSATTNEGYYIGRYEAGDSSNTEIADRTETKGTSTAGTLVCKANQVPYNWITQPDASSGCRNMYADGYSSGTFSSDLINSYAWDTALVFLQTFDNRADKTIPYSGQNSLNTSLSTTGTKTDVICNIYDMASNCLEMTTETYDKPGNTGSPCVVRGGTYDSEANYTRGRGSIGATASNYNLSFRPLLYVGL